MSLILRCHTCGKIQRDRRGYRDHLLREHNEVSRRGFDVPVRVEGRELAAVWASVRRHQVSGTTQAARCREELGLPHVSNREAERRLHDNRARSARRHRAAARARGAAQAALSTQGAATPEPAGVIATRLGAFQARPLAVLAGTVRLGGSRQPRSPCPRCLTGPCQTTRNLSDAQNTTAPPPRCSTSPILPPSPRCLHTRSPKRDPSPGPPQLSHEEAQPDTRDDDMSWAEAQASFSLGPGPRLARGFYGYGYVRRPPSEGRRTSYEETMGSSQTSTA